MTAPRWQGNHGRVWPITPWLSSCDVWTIETEAWRVVCFRAGPGDRPDSGRQGAFRLIRVARVDTCEVRLAYGRRLPPWWANTRRVGTVSVLCQPIIYSPQLAEKTSGDAERLLSNSLNITF